MRKNDFKRGMTVYLLKQAEGCYQDGRIERYSEEQRTIECTVRTVGKKYLTVRGTDDCMGVLDVRFEMENNFKQSFDGILERYMLFLNRESIHQYLERKESMDLLKSLFQNSRRTVNISDDDLYEIRKICQKYF